MNKVFENIIEKLEEAEGNVPVNRLLDDIIKEKPKELGQLIAYNKAIEIVKQEAEKFGSDTNVWSNDWIPCSSGEMPRANGWYLVTNHPGVVQEQRWSANHWEKLRDDAVLAWRELPLPYQPKGE